MTLQDEHLNALIAHGQRQAWVQSQGLLIGEHFRLRSAGAAQKKMPAVWASQNHTNFYVVPPRNTLVLMQQVRQQLNSDKPNSSSERYALAFQFQWQHDTQPL